jgi:hypothetical protein
MKNKLSSALLVAVVMIAGCATPSASDVQNTINTIDATVPIAVGAPSGPVAVWQGIQKPFKAKSDDGQMFHAKEMTLEFSGSYTSAQPGGITRFKNAWNGVWGGNIEADYWLTQNFAIGAEAGVTDIYETSSALFTYSAADFKARLPIGPVAPYCGLALGRNFADGTYYAAPVVGLEVRLTPRVGVFGDVAWAFQTVEPDAMRVRFGMVVAF